MDIKTKLSRLRAVRALIQENHSSFNYDNWMQHRESIYDDYSNALNVLDSASCGYDTSVLKECTQDIVDNNSCNTRACVAGFTVSLYRNLVDFENFRSFPDEATSLLGLTDLEREFLFFGTVTPSDVEMEVDAIKESCAYLPDGMSDYLLRYVGPCEWNAITAISKLTFMIEHYTEELRKETDAS